jgi:hypothetical protein
LSSGQPSYNWVRISANNTVFGDKIAGRNFGLLCQSPNCLLEQNLDGTYNSIGSAWAGDANYHKYNITFNKTHVRVFRDGVEKIANTALEASFPNGKVFFSLEKMDSTATAMTYQYVTNVSALNMSASFSPPNIPILSWSGYAPPVHDHQNNLSRTYFYNLTGAGASYCTLKNLTGPYFINSSSSKTINKKYNITAVSLNDGTYSFFVRCKNGSSWYNSSIKTLTVDLNSPTININPPNFFRSDNLSVIGVLRNQKAPLSITFGDNNDLFAYQVRVFNSSGYTVLQWTNTSISGTSYLLERTLNLSGKKGFYFVNVSVWDSHTALAIDSYDINTFPEKIDFGKGLEISSVGAVATKATKLKDRYSFDFTYSKDENKVYIVKGESLVYLPNSKYSAHFVDFASKRWVDFEGAKGKISVNQVEKGVFEVFIEQSGLVAGFNSVGGLNEKREVFRYSVNPLPSISFSSSSIFLPVTNTSTIGINVFGDFLNTTKVYLYNESWSLKNVSTISFLANGSYAFSVSYSGLSGRKYYFNASHKNSLNDSVKSSQGFIARLIVENCSIFHNQTASFCFFDENNPLVSLPVNYEMQLDYWTIGSSPASITYKAPNASCLNLCFSPSYAQFYGDITLKHYSSSNMTTYLLLFNHSFSNVSQSFPLYNFGSGSGVLGLKNTVRYKSTYQYFPNVVSVLSRRYVSDAIYRPVQYSLTGQFGENYFWILPNTQDYKISFYDQNNRLLSTTSSVKFVCDNYNILCDISYLIDSFALNTSYVSPSVVWSYNNNTKMIYATVSNPSAVNLSFRTVKRGNDGLVCGLSFVGASYLYSCNVSSVGSGQFDTSLTDSNGVLIDAKFYSVVNPTLSSLLGVNASAIIAFIIILACAGLCIVNPVVGAVGVFIGFVAVYSLGFMPFVTMGALAVVGIGSLFVGWLVSK